jgi:hypothetical protein
VTIWGLSSGSQYVATLCSSPAAEGLFHRAFVQSCTDVGNVRKLKTGSVIWQGKSAEDYGPPPARGSQYAAAAGRRRSRRMLGDLES